jgi:16S rRNA processing protein RimM
LSKEELLPVGKITGLHGIRGEVKVLAYGGVVEFPFKTVILRGGGCGKGNRGKEEIGRGLEALEVKSVRSHKGGFLVFFRGYGSREASEELVGLELFVKREDLPPLEPDEFYQHELIGMNVVTDDGRDLGKVTGIIPTGAADVIEVKGPLGEVLIPMAGDFIVSVDMDANRLVVRLIEGLLPGEK